MLRLRTASACIGLWALACGAPQAPARGEDVAWIWPGGELPSTSPGELAVLTHTVLLGPGAAEVRPRRDPVPAPPGVRLTPVVHVQPDRAAGALSAEAAQAVVQALLRARAQGTSGWVQLDFEAPAADREAWRALVAEARRALPGSTRLSVTALASWCLGGAWLDGLAADEVVPMFFALGPEATAWRRQVAEAPGRLHARCRAASAGFSVQEAPPPAVRRRYARRYWFHEGPPRPYALPLP